MNIICPECKSRFKIPDEKLHELQGAVLACPKCGGRVPVGAEETQEVSDSPIKDESLTYDASSKPFDFLEAGSLTAIVCATEAGVKETFLKALDGMGYRITEAGDSREALRNMWYHAYSLVVVDELFDTQNPDYNRVLAYLEGLGMAQRREMVVVLVSRSRRTLDEMGAFEKSVNVIVNIKHLEELPRILPQVLGEHETFYKVYRELTKKETAL